MLVEPDMRKYGCDYFAYGSDRLPLDASKGGLTGFPPYIWGINRYGCARMCAHTGTSHASPSLHLPSQPAGTSSVHARPANPLRPSLVSLFRSAHASARKPLAPPLAPPLARPLAPLFGTYPHRCVAKGAWADVKPVSYFCPEACGCHAGDEHCPDQCPSRPDPPTELCPSYQKVLANDFPALTSCALGPAPDATPR